jgi:hypothetical protein
MKNEIMLLRKDLEVSKKSLSFVEEAIYPLSQRLMDFDYALIEHKNKELTNLLGANIYSPKLGDDLDDFNAYTIGKVEDYLGEIPDFAKESMAQVIDSVIDKTFIDLGVFGKIKIHQTQEEYNKSAIVYDRWSLAKCTEHTSSPQYSKHWGAHYCYFSILAPTSDFITQNAPKVEDPVLFTLINVNKTFYYMEIARWA